MAPSDVSNSALSLRKRRAHKKSRNGCRNCKLRRVKCDETKPTCKSCDKFSVTCNYDARQPDLETAQSRRIEAVTPLPVLDPVSLNDALLSMINESLLANYPKGCGQPLQLELDDLDTLKRWQNRTVLSIASGELSKVYHKVVIKSVARFPYLMHAVLALTTKHDRYLSPDARHDPKRRALEYFHYGRSASLFSVMLSLHTKATAAAEDDALWSTAVFLGSLASGTLDGESPEHAWPLKDGTSGEALTWLRVHKGLHVLWMISQPFAPGRMFHELLNTPEHNFMATKLNPFLTPGIETVPPDFCALCGLDEQSTTENNPYFRAVRALVPLIDLEWVGPNRLKFMGFTSMMDARYKDLLKDKDPAALVILAWWYALILRSPWYMSKRARIECQSICIYLGRKCPENELVQRLLKFPRSKTGLSVEQADGRVAVLLPKSAAANKGSEVYWISPQRSDSNGNQSQELSAPIILSTTASITV